MARTCGDCSLCCKLVGVTEINKPGNRWCEHALPGKGGCSIYEGRPESCRAFRCGWLADEAYGDHWKPLRCKMVIGFDPLRKVLEVYVDASNRRGWEREPWFSDIKRLAWAGRGKYGLEIRQHDGSIIEVKADG